MLNTINSKGFRAGLLLTGAAVISVFSAQPVMAKEKAVSLEQGEVVQLTFLRDLQQPANGRPRTTTFYNDALVSLIEKNGGEFVFVLDTVSIEEGIIAPDAIGFVTWPNMEAYRAFASSQVVSDHRSDVQHIDTFLTVPQAAQFTLDEDKYYEVFGVNFNANNQPRIMDFFGAVIPTAIQKHGRTALVDLAPLDVPESGLRSQAVGLVEWPSNIDFKNFSDSDIIQSNVQNRNAAADNFYAVFGDIDL